MRNSFAGSAQIKAVIGKSSNCDKRSCLRRPYRDNAFAARSVGGDVAVAYDGTGLLTNLAKLLTAKLGRGLSDPWFQVIIKRVTFSPCNSSGKWLLDTPTEKGKCAITREDFGGVIPGEICNES